MNHSDGMRRTFIVFTTEILHILRDPASLIVALVMPMFLLFLIGYSINFELRDAKVAVYNMDGSTESEDYIAVIDNTKYFSVSHRLIDYLSATETIKQGDAKLSIIIPPDFSRNIASGEEANIQTIVDASYINSALFILNYLEAINAAHSASITTSFLRSQGAYQAPDPIRLSTRSWYNQSLREITFKITGSFSVVILGFVPILSALAIVREKESGSIQQVFASPVRPMEYVAGKMVPYVIFLTLDYLFVILFGIWFFDLPFRGSITALFAATFVMVFSCVSIGFFISTLTRSQLAAMMLAIVFTLMPALIYGDAIAPLDNSPVGFRMYACLFPGRFYTAICRAVLLKGSDIRDYMDSALALCAYAACVFSICAWRVKNKHI